MNATDRHVYVNARNGTQSCSYPIVPGQTCGLQASNGAVHVSASVLSERRHLAAVPPVDRPAVSVALDAPATSVAAAEVALPRRGSLRMAIVDLLAHPNGLGLTDDEIEQATGRPHTSVSSARNSLMRDRIVEPLVRDGRAVTRPTRASGTPATVWVLTAAGGAARNALRTRAAAS